MNCKKAQELMLDALYGELPPSTQEALQEHLNSCVGCANEFAGHKATVAAFKKMKMEKPPEALSELMREIAVREMEQEALLARKSRRPQFWKPALAAAAVVVLVGAGVLLSLPKGQSYKQLSRISSNETGSNREMRQYEASDKLERAKPAAAVQQAQMLDESEKEAPAETLSAPLPEPPAVGFMSPQGDGRRKTALEEAPPNANDAAMISSAGEGASASGVLANVPLKGKKEAALAESSETDSVLLKRKEEDANTLESTDLSRGLEFRSALSVHSKVETTVDDQYRLGMKYQESGDYEKALSEFKNIMENHSDFKELGSVYLAAGDCYLALGQTVDAIKAYETARDQYRDVRDKAIEKLSLIERPGDSPSKPSPPEGDNQ